MVEQHLAGAETRYLAHTENLHGQVELLRGHLKNVSVRAVEFAETFGAADEAGLAGLLHDLGKYGDLFQRRLQGLEKGIDHWTPGAWAAIRDYRSIAAALAVQGHHIGLQTVSGDALRALDPSCPKEPRNLRVSDTDVTRLLDRALRDGLPVPEGIEGGGHYSDLLRTDFASAMLDVRMLFSVLVDADFVETETHFEGGSIRPEPLMLEPARAASALSDHLSELAAKSASAAHVNAMRTDLLAACLQAADRPRGTYTLTAPTGTGKTLAMMAFALRHAAQHDLRRIVVVIPYLSIIDQTAKVYGEIFSRMHAGTELERYVLEHHSLAGTRERPEEETDGSVDRRQTRLLAENWDAPIIVTTSVQMLESLFANRPSPCRKLHRLAGSIILFDEVQTIPRRLAVPTLATLSRLSERYGTTVVFATATQPAFGEMDEDVRRLCTAGWKPAEIVPKSLDLARRARRVEVAWPEAPDTVTPWSKVVEDLGAENQALCIVNLKRHAVRLFRSLSVRGIDGLFHLSTSMCPKHREVVLDEVRSRLAAARPCRLISTQCVEAGVDIDFPVVYRAWGPLEAIVQAAGRCNRNGRATSGKVRVFVPEFEEGRRGRYPDRAYQQAADVLAQMLRSRKGGALDPHDPEVNREYYGAVFKLMESADESEIVAAIRDRDFVEVDRKYRLIDGDTVNVLVPYDRNVWRALKEEAQATFLTRSWMARARPYTVSLFRPRGDAPVAHYLDPVPVNRKQKSDEWFVYVGEEHYDRDLGLVPPEIDACWMV